MFYTKQQIQELFGLPDYSLYSMIHDGRIHAYLPLKRIKMLLLFLKGNADPFHATTNGRVFSADYRLLEGGHDLMLNVRVDEVTSIMAAWLQPRPSA